MSVFGDRAVILSNSAGSSDDKEYKKAKEIEKALGVPVLRHSEKVHQQHDKQHLPTHLYCISKHQTTCCSEIRLSCRNQVVFKVLKNISSAHQQNWSPLVTAISLIYYLEIYTECWLSTLNLSLMKAITMLLKWYVILHFWAGLTLYLGAPHRTIYSRWVDKKREAPKPSFGQYWHPQQTMRYYSLQVKPISASVQHKRHHFLVASHLWVDCNQCMAEWSLDNIFENWRVAIDLPDRLNIPQVNEVHIGCAPR